MVAIFRVVIKGRARKQLQRCPGHIIDKLETWIDAVEQRGLEEVRKVPGYHDELLKGKLRGVRSVRLGLGFRAYYRIEKGEPRAIVVEEVNKHDYKAIERLLGK